MDDKLFAELVESLDEVDKHVKGKVELKTTTISVAEVPVYTPEMIRNIRTKMNLSQRMFGEVLGVSLRAVESWEGGKSKPLGSSRRMLSLLDDETLSADVTHKFVKVG